MVTVEYPLKAIITFLGGPECGNVGSTTWGSGETGTIEFPVRTPVLVDSEAVPAAKRAFTEHVIKKARTNPFFTVEDAAEGADAAAAVVQDRKPEPRLKHNPKRGEKPATARPE